MNENFQPKAVNSPQNSPLFFQLRCIVDLQLLTIYRFLSIQLKNLSGNILDVGAGRAPWKSLLPPHVDYVGIDVYSKDDFGMANRGDIMLYDGIALPFGPDEFDNAMCIEVLEHVPDPTVFLSELCRVLKPGAPLLLTVPWAARIHYVPHDYHRFTRFRLKSLLESSGFRVEQILERGNDIATISNKLIVLQASLLNSKNSLIGAFFRASFALFLLPLVLVFLAAAHYSINTKRGSLTDPLGYSIIARKRALTS